MLNLLIRTVAAKLFRLVADEHEYWQ